jgi:pimeloyl-ACP methyl ester carboxylesterase
MDPRFNFLRFPAQEALPLRTTFAHSNTAFGSVRLNYWPARRRAPPTRVVLFLPGNPGCPEYYTPFLTMLHARLPDSHAVLCTSHVGGEPSIAAPDQPLDLRQQVDAKVELVSALRASLEAWPRKSGEAPQLVVAAHSVGSWMTCELAKVIDIPTSYLLFPTLGWIANTYHGWTMWPLFHRPLRPLLPWISYLTRPLLPFVTLPAASYDLLRSPATIKNALHLAHSEMAIIREPDEKWFRAQSKLPAGKGVHSIWSAGNIDGWVGSEGPMIQGWLGEDRVVELEGVRHAFCLWEEDYSQVADVLAGWIVEGNKAQVLN